MIKPGLLLRYPVLQKVSRARKHHPALFVPCRSLPLLPPIYSDMYSKSDSNSELHLQPGEGLSKPWWCCAFKLTFIYSKWHLWPSPSPYCSFKSALISLHNIVRALEGESVPKQASSDKALSTVGWKPPGSGYWLYGNLQEWRCDLAAKWQKDLEWGWFFPLLSFWFNQTFPQFMWVKKIIEQSDSDSWAFSWALRRRFIHALVEHQRGGDLLVSVGDLLKAGLAPGKICSRSGIFLCYRRNGSSAWPGSFLFPTCPVTGDHYLHATSRAGREAQGMQEREVCAVYRLCTDLSALERVWGYGIGAVGVSLYV